MTIRPRDIYQGRKKSRSRAGTVILAVLAVLIAAILLFYWLRQYAVYDENGNATLILPFSQNRETVGGENPDAGEEPSPDVSARLPEA
ncbi:MAG: hypothetical protein LBL15_05915 [Oscillospiraceae bacterium]|nr:hypothetical protein [Oscillospiraceae bacterium]